MAELTSDELAELRSQPIVNRNGSTIDRVDRLLATIDALTAERDTLAAWKRAAEPVIAEAQEVVRTEDADTYGGYIWIEWDDLVRFAAATHGEER